MSAMSSSSGANESAAATHARDVPAVRHAALGVPPPSNYGTSPGGTIFSTTPNG